MITLISAMNLNGVIGDQNKIPWKIKEDMKFFKEATTNNAMIMGRKTWESIGSKALPKRHNIVISSNKELLVPTTDDQEWQTKVFSDLDAALLYCGSIAKETFIIGGASIYEQSLIHADRLLITAVKDKADGDCKFPHWDEHDGNMGELFKSHGFKSVGLIKKIEKDDFNEFDCDVYQITKLEKPQNKVNPETIKKFVKAFRKQTLRVDKKEKKKIKSRAKDKAAKIARKRNRK